MLPNSAALTRALLDVLKEHPNGLHSKDIDRLASDKLGISETDLGVIRSGTRTEFAYNDSRMWAITDSGKLIK